MADTEKVVCYDRPTSDNTALLASLMNGQNNSAETMALMNNMGGQWNNPFIYLVWMMFANRFFGNGADAAQTSQNAEILSRVNELGTQMNTNQNTNLMMDAINGNHEALHSLSASLGVDFATLNGAITGVQNAITQVGGQVGMTGERVVNSVLLGNKDLTAALQTCCCENKTLQLQNFAALQLQNAQNQAAIQTRIDTLANGVQTGFANIGYQNSQNTAEIVNAINASQQKTSDLLQNHWTAELSQALQDEKFKNSQLEQNNYIASLLSSKCSCS